MGMDEATTVAAPQPQRPSRKLLFLGIGAIVFIALIGAAIFFFRVPALEAYDAMTLPAELHSAKFMINGKGGFSIYRWNERSYTAEVPGVLSADEQGSNEATIRRGADNTFEVWVNGTKVTSSRAPKTEINLSPDGTKVAYAELWALPPVSGVPAATSTPRTLSSTKGVVSTTTPPAHPVNPLEQFQNDAPYWRVIVLDTKTGAQAVIGQGVAPLFMSNTALLRFASDGIRKYDFTATIDRKISTDEIASSADAVHISPDHTLIAWYDMTKHSLTVKRLSADGLTEVKTLSTVAGVSGFALGNSGIYWVTPAPKGSTVWKIALDAKVPKLIHNFAKSFAVVSIIL
jgi:hypothetical protein